MIRPLTHGLDDAIMDECIRVMKRVNIYIWGNWRAITGYLDRFRDWDRFSTVLMSWHKTNPVPTCSNKYLNDTEYCLFVRERGVPLYGGYKDHGTYWTTPTNVGDKKLYLHPTIKPLDIIRTMIRNSSKSGDTVLDPFLGSGTT